MSCLVVSQECLDRPCRNSNACPRDDMFTFRHAVSVRFPHLPAPSQRSILEMSSPYQSSARRPVPTSLSSSQEPVDQKNAPTLEAQNLYSLCNVCHRLQNTFFSRLILLVLLSLIATHTTLLKGDWDFGSSQAQLTFSCMQSLFNRGDML